MKKYAVYLREKITLTGQTVTDHVRLCKRNKLFQIGTEIGIIDETEGFLSLNKGTRKNGII